MSESTKLKYHLHFDKILKPAVLNREVKYTGGSIQEQLANIERDSEIFGSMEEVVEEMIVESVDEEFVDESLEEPPFVETIEDLIPEQYRLIPHTSYSVLKKVMDTFMNSKRRTRDIENIDAFIQGGPTCGCARIDALYKVRAGIKSHIAVQDKDQYWAEQEKLFPHLIQMHEDEASAMDKSQIPDTSEPKLQE